MDDLLPCPFCGGEAVVSVAMLGCFKAQCQGHDCLVFRVGVTRDGAIAAWNRRATPERTPEGTEVKR